MPNGFRPGVPPLSVLRAQRPLYSSRARSFEETQFPECARFVALGHKSRPQLAGGRPSDPCESTLLVTSLSPPCP